MIDHLTKPFEAGCRNNTASFAFRPCVNSPYSRHFTRYFLLFKFYMWSTLTNHMCILYRKQAKLSIN